MFGLSDSYKYFVCTQPVRGNASESTLFRHACAACGTPPTSGDAFIIFSTDRHKMSVVRWDGENLIIFNKFLTHSTFRIPRIDADVACFELCYDDVFTLVRKNCLSVPRALQRAKKRAKDILLI